MNDICLHIISIYESHIMIKKKKNFQLEHEGISDKKILLAARSQDQLEEILRRKRSLSLNLKRALPASPGGRSSSSGDASSDDMLSSTDQLRFSLNGSSLQDDDENHNRKRKIAAALNLMYPELITSSIDTVETFHTAAADSPEVQFPELEAKAAVDAATTTVKTAEKPKTREDEYEDSKSDNDLDFKTSIDEMRVFQRAVDETKQNGTGTDYISSAEVVVRWVVLHRAVMSISAKDSPEFSLSSYSCRKSKLATELLTPTV